MHVWRYDYPAQFGEDINRLLMDIQEMLVAGRYVLTGEVSDFELAFGTYLGARHVCGVGAGTDALILALINATVAAIRMVGAVPVLVDAREDSFLIDEDHVRAALTSRTRVVIPVHLYGKPTPIDTLQAMADAHRFDIVEDAAQAHGARTGGRSAGTIATIGCFSFHPSKNLAAAGDGGAVVTNSAAIAQDIRRRRELGQEGQGNHLLLGLNSKLDAIQARILSWKLPHLENWNARRRWVANCYRERLTGLPLSFQQASPDEEHVYHLFQIRTGSRDRLLKFLRDAGIDVVVRYPCPIHLQPAFADCGWLAGQFPVAERLGTELLCLPIRPTLSIDEIDYVCDHVRRFFGSSS
jgi:dTDP-4-amino-4,6-dideoxygalactose transaminase